jgi:hypothetical protein
MGIPMWKENAKELINKTLPPYEEKIGYGERITFIDSLALSIVLGEDGKLLLEALREKWSDAVESHIDEANGIARAALLDNEAS